jgi:hypothetical protein
MNYLFITAEAISHLITARQYQSIEYAECPSLISALKGDMPNFNDGIIKLYSCKDGLILYSEKIKSGGGVFFDYNQYTTLKNEKDYRFITIVQKVLRFASKYFKNSPKLAPCEKIVDEKAIIFPFPYYNHGEAYRVVLDRNTFRKGKTLNFLTVFYGGSNEHAQAPDFRQLDHFYEEYKALNEPISQTKDVNTYIPSNQIEALKVRKLTQFDYPINNGLNASQWEDYLTEPQLKFVHAPINGVERLQGAAGTGKTLSMILKCIFNLKQSDYTKRYIFVTHSIASKESIKEQFIQICPEIKTKIILNGYDDGCLMITTLQEWCIRNLGTNISDNEYLDRDAMKSKQAQNIYIQCAFDEIKKNNYETYKPLLSHSFIEFIELYDDEIRCDMLQYEFAVVLKGRADGDLEKYKKLSRPHYGIPCNNSTDFMFVHLVFSKYQDLLIDENRFDSDDIVLSSLSNLKAPIWRRRRDKEGFDACFIDETHLFNFNELNIFPFLNKTVARNNIIFAIDESQFSGEVMQKAEDVLMLCDDANANIEVSNRSTTIYRTIFRTSSYILNLAYNILSMGANIFDNFDNPLVETTEAKEKDINKQLVPKYILVDSDDDMFKRAIDEAKALKRRFKISRADCLIVCTSDVLTSQMVSYCQRNHLPHVQLTSRGDELSLKQAITNNKYVVGGIDYIGGIECNYVIMIGVDESRVPPKVMRKSNDFHFTNYAWHRRMYVAITRAQYGLLMIGNKSEGSAYMLENARLNNLIECEQ